MNNNSFKEYKLGLSAVNCSLRTINYSNINKNSTLTFFWAPKEVQAVQPMMHLILLWWKQRGVLSMRSPAPPPPSHTHTLSIWICFRRHWLSLYWLPIIAFSFPRIKQNSSAELVSLRKKWLNHFQRLPWIFLDRNVLSVL